MNLVEPTGPNRKFGDMGHPVLAEWSNFDGRQYQKAHSPLRIRGSTLPAAVMPSKSISLDPIIQST
jgi:hypothetical protein